MSSRISVRSTADTSERRLPLFAGAERTIQGYEAIDMIRKGQLRWLAKGNIAEQVHFVKLIFGLSV